MRQARLICRCAAFNSQIFWVELIRRTKYQGDPYHATRNEMKIGKESCYRGATPVPETSDLGELRKKAAKCQACPLFRNATQTVFGVEHARHWIT